MAWEFSESKPIFRQIVDKMMLDIVSGVYQSGEKLPAVRELAVTAGVNPNTVQRALSEIEETGLIYTKRGDGRYVSENSETIQHAKGVIVNAQTESFVKKMSELKLNDEEIRLAVNNYLEKGKAE